MRVYTHGFVYYFFMIILFGGLMALNWFFAKQASNCADEKGYPRWKWFHLCFWLGVIPYILVAALPDLRLRAIEKENAKRLEAIQKQLEGSQPTAPAAAEAQVPAKNPPAAALKLRSAVQEKRPQSLQEKLEYALKYSTDDGMVRYLQSALKETQGSDKDTVERLLQLPPSAARSEMREYLNIQ